MSLIYYKTPSVMNMGSAIDQCDALMHAFDATTCTLPCASNYVLPERKAENLSLEPMALQSRKVLLTFTSGQLNENT